MADHEDFDTPDSPPPPAYEFCQQEFDRKVSHALEASQAETRRESADEEDEWEVWDEAAFAAAAARLAVSDAPSGAASGSTSYLRSPPADVSVSHLNTASGTEQAPQGPSPGNGKGKSDGREDDAFYGDASASGGVQPLRIVKKAGAIAQPGSVKEKERPSWFAEAQLDAGPPRGASQPAASFRAQVYRSDSIASRSDTPPPVFTPIGPSLDGPPYEASGVVLTYTSADSRPASPLHSPVSAQASLTGTPFVQSPIATHAPAVPYTHGRSGSGSRRSLPQPPQSQSQPQSPPPQSPSPARSLSPAVQTRPAHESLPAARRVLPSSGSPRPMSTFTARSVYDGPRLAFDPKLAYTSAKSSLFDSQQEPMPAKVDAAALYSSAVSSLYSSTKSGPAARAVPGAKLATPSIYSANSPYSNAPASRPQSSYYLPQNQGAVSQSPGNSYGPSREAMKSPAPSEASVASHQSSSSPYNQQPTSGRYGYQAVQSSYRAGTGYQATPYQPTSYQSGPYQGAVNQQSSARPATTTAYQPNTYQNSYQPTAY